MRDRGDGVGRKAGRESGAGKGSVASIQGLPAQASCVCGGVKGGMQGTKVVRSCVVPDAAAGASGAAPCPPRKAVPISHIKMPASADSCGCCLLNLLLAQKD